MLGLNLNGILLLFFVIFCDPSLARSKKKDLSRFTQSLDLVSVLKQSLRRNNDDYKDNQPDNITTRNPTTENTEVNEESDTETERNSIDYARRNINDPPVTQLIDKSRILLAEQTTSNDKSDEKTTKADFIKSSNRKKFKSDENHAKPYFMKSLEETKLENKKINKQMNQKMKSHSSITTRNPATENTEVNEESDTETERNSIDYARRNINDHLVTQLIDKNRILLAEQTTLSDKSDDKTTKADFIKSSNRKKFKSDESHAKPYFMKSLEETKLGNKKIKSHSSHYMTTFHKKTKSANTKRDPEQIVQKDPWFEVVHHEMSLAPYLFGKETTKRLMYKMLTVKRARGVRRRSGSPHFLQTELRDSGVVVAPIGLVGPPPDFKLPKERRQYRVDSDDENEEGNSAVSGDDDALVPR